MSSKPYTKLNFITFSLSCFFNISFIVFLTSTQSFFLTDILGIHTKTGDYIGTLGFMDELVSMSLSPFLGALSDQIGAKYIQVTGVAIIGSTFWIFTLAKNVYPDLLLIRMLFAVGATASASMMTALLAELSSSGFELSSLFKKQSSYDQEQMESQEPETPYDDESDSKKNGKLTSVIGMSSGLGALFSVSMFLPLPNKLGESEPPASALKHSYMIVGSIAILVSIFLSWGLFSSKKLKIPFISKWLSPYDYALDDLESEVQEDLHSETKSYVTLLKLGFKEAKDPKIGLAYFGGFLARSTTIISAVFIPLYVNKYYYSTGICTMDDANGCREAYVQAAILTGILHLCSLIFAPIFGMITDRFGQSISMLISCVFGIISSFGFAMTSNPKSVSAVIMSCFFGVSSIGVILTSMSLCTDKKRSYNGAISGVYSLSGGFGILIISKIGGYFADFWIGSPFIILCVFHIIMIVVTLYVDKQIKINRIEI